MPQSTLAQPAERRFKIFKIFRATTAVLLTADTTNLKALIPPLGWLKSSHYCQENNRPFLHSCFLITLELNAGYSNAAAKLEQSCSAGLRASFLPGCFYFRIKALTFCGNVFVTFFCPPWNDDFGRR